MYLHVIHVQCTCVLIMYMHMIQLLSTSSLPSWGINKVSIPHPPIIICNTSPMTVTRLLNKQSERYMYM